ncbi:MAG: lamin tail domain-containing protein [Myxococcota bacterium]
MSAGFVSAGWMTLSWVACSRTDAPVFDSDSGGTPSVDSGSVVVATAVEPGELVVSEIMPDPNAVDGDFGEFVEVTSLASRALDLVGLTFADDDGDGFTVEGSLVLPVGGRLVFGPSDDASANGGVSVDRSYDVEAFKLGNEGDTVSISRGAVPIDVVVYEAVTWGLTEGASLSHDPSALDPIRNDDAQSWCIGQSPYGDGDLGTPGAPNDPC